MYNKLRRTKIVCTLGPSTDKDNNLEKIIKAGANVVRLNFSHGNPEDHIRRANEVRKVANKLGKIVAILGDLQGPKIRISTFKNGKIILKENNTFILDANLPKNEGDEESVGIDYKELPNDLKIDDILLLDDGKIRLQVIKIENQKIYTKVIIGGTLSNNKGINKLHGGLSAKSITDKDKDDILLAAKIDVDYLAVSFPRSAEDINYARSLAQDAGLNAKIIAKIERAETIASDEIMESIILASDVIMVARGDLGVEIEYPNLVLIQKKLILRTRELNRIVITATQMMESMIENPTPTRAEVMDVANAVLDGTDAVMLSAETSVGKYPEETVKSMVEICLGAETMPKINISSHRLSFTFDNIEEMTAMSAMYSANHLDGVNGVIGLTTSGNTVRYMSRISSPLPIYGVSRHEKTLRLMALYRGVLPIHWGAIKKEGQEDPYDCFECINHLKKMSLLKNDDLVILTHGINTIINNKPIEEKSNTCLIIRVQ